MIFFSENGLTDPSREAAWDLWYHEHLSVMSSVNGVDSAQRFKGETRGRPPSLAMYTVVSEAVYRDPYYLSIRGLGEFEGVRDPRFARRNLFSGLDVAPRLTSGQRLLVLDCAAPSEVPGIAFVWLSAVALDRTTPCRGIAVVTPEQAASAAGIEGVGVYVPVTGVYVNGKAD